MVKDIKIKAKIVKDEDCVKTIVEFTCMICDKKYQKETFVPLNSIDHLNAVNRFGICPKCKSKPSFTKEEKKKMEKYLKTINVKSGNDVLIA